MMKNSQILVSGAITFKDQRGKRLFLLVKMGSLDGWEIPKITVRRGESSVRASLRMLGEQAGISAKVLEEAGRSSGTTILNGKSIPQKFYYYLIRQIAAGEVIGFSDFVWLEYGKAVNKLALKKEKTIFRQGREVLREWDKKRQKKN